MAENNANNLNNGDTRRDIEEIRIPEQLVVMPIENTVIPPGIMVPLVFQDETMISCIDEVAVGDKMFALVTQREGSEEAKTPEDRFYRIGTAIEILQMLKYPDKTTRLLVRGVSRIRIEQYTQRHPCLKATVSKLSDVLDDTAELRAMMRNAVGLFERAVSLVPHLPDELKVVALNINHPGKLADFISTNIPISTAEKQEMLETLDISLRLSRVLQLLRREVEILELGSKIQDSVQTELSKSQREYYLREQLKAIQKELGDVDEKTAEINELKKRLDESKLPPEARKEADRELDRLARMPPAAAEYIVSRTYLEWLIALPWAKQTEDHLDVEAACKVLDTDHYDLEKVKERILEYLAVRKLKPDVKGSILCFVGPPGVGKTSLGKSIARAMGRKFMRISLGGVRDEAEIRGHRRTYVGALPGRIIEGLRKAGSNNPVFMLDEIDKLGTDFRGDPASALLEVLDPEQNFSFTDHYLDVPFDLSKVMFITTGNLLDPIPPPLLDRMEVLELPGYTDSEKIFIARRYLIPKQIEANGLKKKQVRFTLESIRKVISQHTREAGVRNLERELGSICRKIAREVAEGKVTKMGVDGKLVDKCLGPPVFHPEAAARESKPGVATGLAWTAAGGTILFVESTMMKGNRGLMLTGQLGEIMKESAQAALSYIRSHADELKIDPEIFSTVDIHVHVPAGGTPKDGPSAGVTIATSLLSLVKRIPVKSSVAMTGEITLQGRVLPVGGIKEKVLAAHRAGIKAVIIPDPNRADLQDVPPEVKKQIKVIFAINLADVFDAAFEKITKKEGRVLARV
ncbi:MAG TPA: endopeptidase La [Planctomycetota bacterium]|nr:endopeptidase La [Planctomycetota bacterium]